MAMIYCPECGKEISDKAASCFTFPVTPVCNDYSCCFFHLTFSSFSAIIAVEILWSA